MWRCHNRMQYRGETMSNRCETCNWWIICAPGVPEGEGLCIRTPHPIYKAGPEECGMWEPKPLPSTSEVNEATAKVAARVAKETVERMFKPSSLFKLWDKKAKAKEHRCGNCRHWTVVPDSAHGGLCYRGTQALSTGEGEFCRDGWAPERRTGERRNK